MYDFDLMTFEGALTEMEKLITSMENPETTLENAILAYEKGASLKRFCEGELKKAKLRVAQVGVNAQDQLEIEPEPALLRAGTA